MIKSKTLNLKILDQAITAVITYVPLLLPLYQRDLRAIAQISTFMMAYSIILGFIRSTFVNIMYEKKSQEISFFRLILTAVAVYTFPIIIGVSIYYTANSFNIYVLALCLSLILSGLQEIFRQILLRFKQTEFAIITDLTWLASMVLMIPILTAYTKSTFLVVVLSWTIGMVVSLIIQSAWLMKLKIFQSTTKPNYQIKTFLKLGFGSLISSSHGLAINAIFVLQDMNQDLGVYRGLLTFFLPISFIINYQQILLLPIMSKNENPKREKSELSFITFLLFPFLTYSSILWVLRDVTLYNFLLGIFTGLIPSVVLFSSRYNLHLIINSQTNSYIQIRLMWFVTSCIVVTCVSLTESLLAIIASSLLIEFFYLAAAKHKMSQNLD
jgi:hypothetical protein